MKPGAYIYCWLPNLYPGRDIVKYAKGLGVTGVVLFGTTPAPIVSEAVDTFKSVYLWRGPSAFLPDNAPQTTRALAEKAISFGCDGIIADAEDAPEWRDERGKIGAFTQALDEARERLDVGFTSFPYWPFVERIAPHVDWGSPQLYGRDGTVDPRVFANWRRKWDGSMRNVVPSLWPQKNRGPQAQRKYLSIFKEEKKTIIFQSPIPKPGTTSWRIQRAFIESANGKPPANSKPPKDGAPGQSSC